MPDLTEGPVTSLALRALPEGGGILEVEERRVSEEASVDDLWPALEGWLYRRLMERQRGLRVVVHASALARKGRVWLFSGESGAGKSVLAARLAARGWEYLSDEFALLDASDCVWPVPRPISFGEGELPPALWRELSADRETHRHAFRPHPGALPGVRYLRPGAVEAMAPAWAPRPLAGAFLLHARAGRPPRMERLRGTRLRAWLFGLRQLGRDRPRPPVSLGGNVG